MPLHVVRELERTDVPLECIEDCTRPGCDAAPAVQHWREVLGLTVDRERAVKHLGESGAWEDDELRAESDGGLADKVLWLACHAFNEGDDSFYLEG